MSFDGLAVGFRLLIRFWEGEITSKVLGAATDAPAVTAAAEAVAALAAVAG